jgi:hypothetical protein
MSGTGRLTRIAMVAALLAAGVLAGAAPVSAADVTPPELVGITVTPDDVSVSGLGHATVTIGVHLRDPSGVIGTRGGLDEFGSPLVQLANTTAGASMRYADVVLTLPPGGDPTDGTWVGSFLVPANADGSWRVAVVGADDSVGNELGIDPATIGIVTSLTVHGSHRPAITLGYAPQPLRGGAALTMKGRAYFTDDGTPIAHRRITIGWSPDGCVNQIDLGNTTTTTDAAGYYHFTFPGPLDVWPGCVYITDPVKAPFDASRPIAILAQRFKTPVVKLALTASLTSSHLVLGQAARVSGKVVPGLLGLGPIHLQRRLASGTWVNVYTTSINATGGYSMRVAPPGRGTFLYRVYQPGCCDGHIIGTMSPTFSVTVR